MADLSDETKRGIEYLRDIFQSGKTLRLKDPQILRQGLAQYFYFKVIAYSKEWDMCLTSANLDDLPGTPEHRDGANRLARGLETRLRNAEVHVYLTANGRFLRIEPIWPPQIYLGDDVPAIPVKIADRESGQQGSCYMRLNSWPYRFNSSPYEEFEDIVNTVRRSIDTEEITISPDPPAAQFLNLTPKANAPKSISAESFIQNKIWKLGVLAGSSPQNPVWLPDSWDLDYFGLSRSAVIQKAAILNAQGKIALLPDEEEFARVGQAMLAQEGPDKEPPSAQKNEFRTALEIYTRVGELGEGGAGRVLRVEDPDGEPFALKYLKPEAVTTQRSKRFRNEMRFCASSNHPHIICVLDWGIATVEGKEVPFYVMPAYSKTLKDIMSGKTDPTILLSLFDQVLAGVQAAHEQGVWHRDLKPQNVLIDSTGKLAVVSDFGIAHFAEPLLHTLVHTHQQDRLGNFQYAAPEQRNNSTVTNLADIYSLGMILYEMFTGKILQGMGHIPIASVNPDYSFLDPIVDRMSQQLPENRIQTVAEVRNKLPRGLQDNT